MSAFEAEAERTHREFSMQELADAFFARALGRARPRRWYASSSRPTSTSGTAACTISTAPPRSSSALAARFTLAVVTNTNDASWSRATSTGMGVRELFARVVTSVEFGVRKPAPAIFAHAVSELGTGPERCVYVGDTYGADYRGATGAGLRAFLIDPGAAAPIPEEHRLVSLLALEERTHAL